MEGGLDKGGPVRWLSLCTSVVLVAAAGCTTGGESVSEAVASDVERLTVQVDSLGEELASAQAANRDLAEQLEEADAAAEVVAADAEAEAECLEKLARPAWLLIATTGIRRGELLGLRWTDVDVGQNRIAIRQALLSVSYKLQFSSPKTDRSQRSVALDDTTSAALRRWRFRQLEEKVAWGPAWQDTGLVFSRDDGSLVHPDRFSKQFDSLTASAELPRIRLHDLRHTHASLMLSAGIHPKVVSERLGHSSVKLTLDTYSHVTPVLQEDAAAQFKSLVLG
jgi:integrase